MTERKKPAIVPVLLMDGERPAKCRICRHPIEVGRRILKPNKKYKYINHPIQPVALHPKEDRRGIYHQHFVHGDCACISFGDIRRAKAEGKSINELLGNVIEV